MAIINRAVSIPMGTAKLISNTGFGDPVEIANIGPGVLYIGGINTVTNANGFPVLPTSLAAATYIDKQLMQDYAGEIWGYAQGGACDVRVLESISG